MKAQPKSKTILIVEDNPVNQKLFLIVLRRHGYRLLTAADGEEALTIAKQELPDLILMDLQLPKINGIMVTQQLKDYAPTAAIPVIALTAHMRQSDQDDERMAIFAGYITKPIDTRAFPQQVHEILDKRRREEQ